MARASSLASFNSLVGIDLLARLATAASSGVLAQTLYSIFTPEEVKTPTGALDFKDGMPRVERRARAPTA